MKEIQLSQGKVTLVDDLDFAFLSQWKWTAMWNGAKWYAYRKDKERRNVYMHRLLAGLMDGANLVDHHDGNGLNNQRHNLREATSQQNNANQRLSSRSNSKTKGVRAKGAKWEAHLSFNNKFVYLGLFDTKQEAARCYDEEAQKRFGAFAKTNRELV